MVSPLVFQIVFVFAGMSQEIPSHPMHSAQDKPRLAWSTDRPKQKHKHKPKHKYK
jgi:hypothetical protein